MNSTTSCRARPDCWFFAVMMAAGLGLCGGLTAVGAAEDSAAAPALGLHAGRDDGITQYDEFGEWLGRKVVYRISFLDPGKWAGIAAPWYLSTVTQWLDSDPERVEVISMPLLPQGEAGNFTTVSSGAHDVDFAAFAGRMVARGITKRVIVRLAWEGNGDWYPWSYLKNPAGFRAAYRRAVQAMRTVAPDLRIEWCISCRAPRNGGAHWTEGYPGDDVVDIISMDVYDHWTPTWDALLNGEAGLKELRAFAIAHNKPEAYPEWSCSTDAGAQGGGDNPQFVEHMADWFSARPGKVLYQAYWNTAAAGPNAAIQGPSAGRVPTAAVAFRRLFGSPAAPSEPKVRVDAP